MERPKIKDHQTKAFHHFDYSAYSQALNKYIDHLEAENKALKKELEKQHRIGYLEALMEYSGWADYDPYGDAKFDQFEKELIELKNATNQKPESNT